MYALLALLAATSASASAGVVGLTAVDQIRVSLNGGDYRPGDKVKVEVSAENDGHLLVFRVDGDGYVRVLFPLDPDLDTWVRGGRRYSLRDRGDDASFLADDRGGTGLVLSVLSRERFSFAGYAAGTRWDYDRLRLADPAGDAEAQLLDIVDRMTDRGEFSYDVVGYRVWGPGYESEQPVVVAGAGWGDPYFDTCLACGWRSPGWSISIGSRWYDPWYDPWYGGYGSPYGRYPYAGYGGWGSGWNGWYGWDPYWGTPYRPITVINTPVRPVVPNPIYGTRARVPQGGIAPATGIGRRLTDPVASPTRVGSTPVTTRSRGGVTPPVTTSRPPTSSATPSRTTTPPPVESERSRSRRPATGGGTGGAVVPPSTPTPTPRVQERGEERPVYRPPTSTSTPREVPARREASPGTRPVSSPPPRREASPPPRQSSPPSRRESPPPAPAPRPSSPPPSTSRSSPPPPPPASSGPTRSRSRGPDQG